ncbi:MAG: DUF4304 domain-containing protein [Chloroflexi bacterium]|nr:DUF4304 domain-containing protein [Chloroflexota bacterium]
MADHLGQTAQGTFRDMLRLEIAPGMRALGFKGSGGRYVLPDDQRWQVVAFQRNRYSRADYLTFTVNLTVADRAAWAQTRSDQMWLPEAPSGNTTYPVDKTIVIRLGNLMPPGGEDRWWEVIPSRTTAQVSSEILRAIETRGIPWLQTGLGAEDLLGNIPPSDIWRP